MCTGNSGRLRFRYKVGENEVCRPCFQDAAMVGKDTLRRVQNYIKEGKPQSPKTKTGKAKQPTIRSSEVDVGSSLGWFDWFIDLCTDEMPESEERHIPIQVIICARMRR